MLSNTSYHEAVRPVNPPTTVCSTGEEYISTYLAGLFVKPEQVDKICGAFENRLITECPKCHFLNYAGAKCWVCQMIRSLAAAQLEEMPILDDAADYLFGKGKAINDCDGHAYSIEDWIKFDRYERLVNLCDILVNDVGVGCIPPLRPEEWHEGQGAKAYHVAARPYKDACGFDAVNALDFMLDRGWIGVCRGCGALGYIGAACDVCSLLPVDGSASFNRLLIDRAWALSEDYSWTLRYVDHQLLARVIAAVVGFHSEHGVNPEDYKAWRSDRDVWNAKHGRA